MPGYIRFKLPFSINLFHILYRLRLPHLQGAGLMNIFQDKENK